MDMNMKMFYPFNQLTDHEKKHLKVGNDQIDWMFL